MLQALPMISVVVPSFNQGRFIAQTLDSIISQQYPNVEIIVIDGGSTDETVDILKRMSQHLTYWVSEPDSGQTEAIKKGFQRCKGDIITWLCSDDLLEPGSLNIVGRAFARHPDWMVLNGNVSVMDTDGKLITHDTVGRVTRLRLCAPWVINNSPAQPSIFFKKALYQSVPGLNEKLHFGMDYDLWLQFVAVTRFRYIPKKLAWQRMHPQSKTMSSPGFAKFTSEWASSREAFLRTQPRWFLLKLKLHQPLYRIIYLPLRKKARRVYFRLPSLLPAKLAHVLFPALRKP